MPSQKYEDIVPDSVIVAKTIMQFMAFFVAVAAGIVIMNEMSKDLDYEDLFEAAGADDELQKIVILSSGSAWVIGGIYSTAIVLSLAIGGVVWQGLWLRDYFSQRQHQEDGEHPSQALHVTDTVNYQSCEDERPTQALLQSDFANYVRDGSNEAGSSYAGESRSESWVQKTKKIDARASCAISRYVGLPVIGGLVLTGMAGTSILEMFGSDENFFTVTLIGPEDEEVVTDEVLAYAMGAYIYFWAALSWGSWTIWEASVAYQLWQDQPQVSIIVNDATSFFQDLARWMMLGFKSSLIMATAIMAYPIFYDGLAFSNSLLQQPKYECPDFFSVLLSPRFVREPESCSSWVQIFALSTFFVRTEICSGIPIILGSGIGGAVLAGLVGTVAMPLTRDRAVLRERVRQGHEFVDRYITIGKRAALLSFLTGGYTLFWIAVPKANDELAYSQLDIRYPRFVYDIFTEDARSDCPALVRDKANSVITSTVWAAFFYPGVGFALIGMGLYGLMEVGEKLRTGLLKLSCCQRSLFFRRKECKAQVPALPQITPKV